MTEDRIKIEVSYGEPEVQGYWAYHAIEVSSGRIVLEGEIEPKAENVYHMLLRPNEGGRQELEDVTTDDPLIVDGKLIDILRQRALELLSPEE